MKGYKIFGPNYVCRGYAFQENNTCDGSLKICKKGFHFCPNAIDCLKYYDYTLENTYAEVESIGDIQTQDDKVVCLKLKIVRKLSYEEFGELLTCDIKTPMLECSYVKGKKHGNYKSWNSNGTLLEECHFVNGIKHGICKSWYSCGTLLEECTFVNGYEDGVFKQWFKNGVLYQECNFVNGKRHGIYTSWDINGKVHFKCNYINDIIHSKS